MSAAKHSPGPWTAKEINGVGMGWKAGPAWLGEKSRSEECAANARLIAASPRMYSYVESRADAGDEEAKKIIAEVSGA